jgi:hypothetical protein
MADNNYNIIKPVENLQNIRGLTPAKRREERKRRQNQQEQNEEEREQQSDETTEEGLKNKITQNKTDRDSIDYCA